MSPAPVDWAEEASIAVTASRLKQQRIRIGLTQRDLAEHLSVSQAWVWRVEAGMQPIPGPKLRSLCLVLGVGADWLLGLPS